jgi:hypothetical protein
VHSGSALRRQPSAPGSPPRAARGSHGRVQACALVGVGLAAPLPPIIDKVYLSSRLNAPHARETVMALKDIIVATQADLRANAQNGQAAFSVDSRQVEELRSETKIRQFSLTVDEPPTLGGSDAGPNPVELVLAALATCQEITYRAYATALGIPLESVSVKLDGALDLRGFFAVSDDVRPGFYRGRRNGDAEESGEPRAARKAQGSGGRPLPSAGHSSRSRPGRIAAHDGANGRGRLITEPYGLSSREHRRGARPGRDGLRLRPARRSSADWRGQTASRRTGSG